jgi:periplasmic divalent cation tolerance protein
MSEEAIVLVSCAPAEAEAIAQPLVQEKLAACVSILPEMISIYRWQGEIKKDRECLLVIKTMRQSWPQLEARIKELHSYSVPEILMVSIEDGHAPYLSWLAEAVPSPIS